MGKGVEIRLAHRSSIWNRFHPRLDLGMLSTMTNPFNRFVRLVKPNVSVVRRRTSDQQQLCQHDRLSAVRLARPSLFTFCRCFRNWLTWIERQTLRWPRNREWTANGGKRRRQTGAPSESITSDVKVHDDRYVNRFGRSISTSDQTVRYNFQLMRDKEDEWSSNIKPNDSRGCWQMNLCRTERWMFSTTRLYEYNKPNIDWSIC